MKKLDLDANNLTAYSYSEGRVGYLQFNCNRVTDENVRKALLFAMDKKAMDDAAYESDEYYSIPYTFLPTNSQFYTEEGVEKYDQDVDKAKSMLKDAGVSNLKLKLGYISSDPVQSAQALLIQEQLKEVGVEVELAGGDATAVSNAMKDPNNEYDMYLGGYIMGIDPDTFSSLFKNGAAYNYMQQLISCLKKDFLRWMNLQEKKLMQNCRLLFKTQVHFIQLFPIIRFWL